MSKPRPSLTDIITARTFGVDPYDVLRELAPIVARKICNMPKEQRLAAFDEFDRDVGRFMLREKRFDQTVAQPGPADRSVDEWDLVLAAPLGRE